MIEKTQNLNNIFCYKSNQFYILTLPKIASSWVYQLFLENNHLRDIPNDMIKYNDNNSININQLNFDIENSTESNLSYDVNEFLKEWNELKNGNDVKSNFIFLMRNPIDKFISGIMQDVIFNDFKMNSPHILEILNTYQNKKDLYNFHIFDKENTLNPNDEWWHNPEFIWPDYVCRVMKYIISSILKKWISDINNITEYRKGHTSLNLFFYYKMLFNSNIKKNRLKILDIDSENICEYLIKRYELKINGSFTEKLNSSTHQFKKILKECILDYQKILEMILYIDVLIYCDIHCYLYSSNITPDKLWEIYFKTSII